MNTEIKEELILNLRQIDGFPLSERKDVFLLEFQKACQQAGFSVAEISSLTRINPQIVEWIYTGEFGNLPSEVFVRGFLKSIAKLLELPPDVLANAYSRTIRDEVKPTTGKAASGLGAHVSPSTSMRAMDSGVKNISHHSSQDGQRPKPAKVNWNFETTEAKRPSHVGDGSLGKTQPMSGHNGISRDGLLESVGSFESKPAVSFNSNSDNELLTKSTDNLDISQELITHGLSLKTNTNENQSIQMRTSEPQTDSQREARKDSEQAIESNRLEGVFAKANSRGKKSKKTKDSQNRSKSSLPSAKSFEGDQNLSSVAGTESSLTQEKVTVHVTPTKKVFPATGSPKRRGKSVSFKIWSVIAGAAIILASIMWPRERAPNGTVIEEADVIDLNSVKAANDQDASLDGREVTDGREGTDGRQESAPSAVSTAEIQGATSVGSNSVGSNSEASVDSPVNLGTAAFSPSAVTAVSPVPLPQGSWATPPGMMLEITAKETVKVKAYIDGKPVVTESLSPSVHKFEFNDKADIYLYDAAAVDISFNGKSLGKVGNKGQFKRLSFVKNVK